MKLRSQRSAPTLRKYPCQRVVALYVVVKQRERGVQADGLARQLKQLHVIVANAGYFAIGMHAAFALFHHYVKRDNTLTRMLPQRWR